MAVGLGRGRVAAGRTDHLTAPEVARAALSIIDEEGLDALTMRRLADEVHVSPRALYHHFSGKASVLEAVVDLVWDEGLDELIATSQAAEPLDLLVAACVTARRCFVRHAEVALYITALPRTGDRLMASSSVIAGLLHEVGFADVGLAFHMVRTYTFGSIVIAATRERANRYFGRDETALRAWIDQNPIDQQGHDRTEAMRAMLPEHDEVLFEQGLRSALEGLLAIQVPPAATTVA